MQQQADCELIAEIGDFETLIAELTTGLRGDLRSRRLRLHENQLSADAMFHFYHWVRDMAGKFEKQLDGCLAAAAWPKITADAPVQVAGPQS